MVGGLAQPDSRASVVYKLNPKGRPAPSSSTMVILKPRLLAALAYRTLTRRSLASAEVEISLVKSTR
jgi:hypothetical protein